MRINMDMKEKPTRWSPGNQFCFVDGYAYSVDQQLNSIRIPEKEIAPLLDGSRKHDLPVINNLITFDINERNRIIKARR